MSVNSFIDHPDACPKCGRPTLAVGAGRACANKQCERYEEVVR